MRDRFRLSTLQDVLAKRELEQEERIIGEPGTVIHRCRAGCGTALQERMDSVICGGCRKRGVVLDRPLPKIEPIPSFEAPMSEKTCSRTGCGKKLRADNTKGVCSLLKNCGGGKSQPAPPRNIPKASVEVSEPPRPRKIPKNIPAAATDTLKRFRLLAEALGFDPDEVLAGFAETWLDKARDAVRPTGPVGRVRLTLDEDDAEELVEAI